MIYSFCQEFKQIKGNTKGIFFILFFRISNLFTSNFLSKLIGFPIRLLYKLFIQWILGIDIPDTNQIGFGFNVYHGQGLIISRETIIGSYLTVRQNTTIGSATKGGGSPIIGDHVQIGANSVIIGNITIGDNSVIAAGSVVIRNVPANVIVAGNPAKTVKELK